MGVGFAVVLLDDEARPWIQQEGIAVPDLGAPSRWPTPKELRSALESLKGYSVSYRANTDGGWDAEIVDDAQGHEVQSATIWTKNLSDDESPIEFSFHKPSLELALMILERLSKACGPLVLVDHSSGSPVVVVPGADVAKLAAQLDGL